MSIRSEPVMLSVDLGSSSLKGFAFDQQGRMLAGIEARVPCELRFTPDGGAEIDLERLRSAADLLMDTLHARVGSRDILGIAFTSFASSLVALDESFTPQGPSLSYADTRSLAQFRALPDDAARIDRTGCPNHTAYWPAQINWWTRHHPGYSPRYWCGVADYLLHRWLGGPLRTTYSLAAWTGCLNRHSLTWDALTLSATHVTPEQLPGLVDHGQPSVGLTQPYAGRWPKFARVPFFPAVGDGAAANVGSGAVGHQRVALTVGSTSALRAALPERTPPVPDGLWAYRVSAPYALLGGALTEGGNLHKWLRDTLNLGSLTHLDDRLERVGADEHGLTFVPSFNGERSPNYQPDARGAIHGLNLSTSPIEILRAGMEAITYRLADLAHRLQPVLGDTPLFIASGKAILSSRVWLQMLSDALDAQVLVTDLPDEASARGAALLALGAIDVLDPYSRPDRLAGTVYTPRGDVHARYRAAMQRQQHVMRALHGLQLPVDSPPALSATH